MFELNTLSYKIGISFKGPSIKDVSSEGEGGGMKNCKLGRLSRLKWGDRGREGVKNFEK